MGNYTELKVDIVLKSDTPEDARLLLDALIAGETDATIKEIKPTHVFWHTYRFDFLGRSNCEGDPEDFASYEFPNLKIRCSVKNYDQILQKFLQWVLPYVEAITGTYHYEEYSHASEVVLNVDSSDLSKPAIHIIHRREDLSEGRGFYSEQTTPKFYTETICLTG